MNIGNTIAIFFIWLFHLSGIFGMTLGDTQWFISETPFHLLACFIILLITYPINSKKKGILVVIFIFIGYIIEWIGVKSGILFGEYEYGINLGTKIDGIPVIIGINWSMLILCTAAIARKLHESIIIKAVIGSLLMIFLDIFIEPVAPQFDYWHWKLGHPPLQNYLAWFIISIFLHWIYVNTIKKGNWIVSVHLYVAQLLFFGFFYAFDL